MTVARFDGSPRTPEGSPTSGESAGGRIPLSPLLAALSRALDLAEGQRTGHALRACLIGMRLGEANGLDARQLAALYHALLLKDLGGSVNAARVADVFGADDPMIKPRLRMLDWDDRRQVLFEIWRHADRGGSLVSRVARVSGILRRRDLARVLLSARAEQGAAIARDLGFPAETVEAIRSLDERFDGRGYPGGLAGDAIPAAAQIMSLAQAVEMHLTSDGADAASAMVRARGGRWFDPRLAAAAVELLRDDGFLAMVRAPDVEQQVLAREPAACAHEIGDDGLDELARAFADIVDAKSPYLAGHSRRVAHHARVIGARMGFSSESLRALYRAGLLHDLGMLGVSSRILEKAGSLNASERTEIEQHPLDTWEIVRRAPGLEQVALLAAMHHEKLDGSGYPWRRGEEELDGHTRVLVVADVFVAAMANRSFRRGLSPAEALEILGAQRGLRLDADAVDALAACVEAGETGADGQAGDTTKVDGVED